MRPIPQISFDDHSWLDRLAATVGPKNVLNQAAFHQPIVSLHSKLALGLVDRLFNQSPHMRVFHEPKQQNAQLHLIKVVSVLRPSLLCRLAQVQPTQLALAAQNPNKDGHCSKLHPAFSIYLGTVTMERN